MAEIAAPPRPARVESGLGCDDDFVLWTERQAALIRAGQLDLVDRETVAEEIESSGRSERRQLRHRLEVLMTHLLKWQFQPLHRSRSWQSTIKVQRWQIERLLSESPSLRRELAGLSRDEYVTAREQAAAQTGFDLRTFPKWLPDKAEQILDEGFYPGPLDER